MSARTRLTKHCSEVWLGKGGRWHVSTPTEHIGSYSRLSDAKRAFARWCKRRAETDLNFPGSQAARWKGQIVEVCERELRHGPELTQVVRFDSGMLWPVWREVLEPIGPVARALVRRHVR